MDTEAVGQSYDTSLHQSPGIFPLHHDILVGIASHLDTSDALSFASVSRSFNASSEAAIWRHIILTTRSHPTFAFHQTLSVGAKPNSASSTELLPSQSLFTSLDDVVQEILRRGDRQNWSMVEALRIAPDIAEIERFWSCEPAEGLLNHLRPHLRSLQITGAGDEEEGHLNLRGGIDYRWLGLAKEKFSLESPTFPFWRDRPNTLLFLPLYAKRVPISSLSKLTYALLLSSMPILNEKSMNPLLVNSLNHSVNLPSFAECLL